MSNFNFFGVAEGKNSPMPLRLDGGKNTPPPPPPVRKVGRVNGVVALALIVVALSFGACEAEAPPIDKMDVDKILPPVLQSAIVKNSDPSAIVLTFDKPMRMDNYKRWIVTVGDDKKSFDEQKFPGGFGTPVITLYINGTVAEGDSVKLTYEGMNTANPQGDARSIDEMPLLAIPHIYVNSQVGEYWKVTLNENGGSNAPKPEYLNVSKGSKVTLPGRSGMLHNNEQKAFKGWLNEARMPVDSSEYEPEGDVTLYANWGDMADVVGAVHEIFVDDFEYKMGDANKNQGIAWDISVLVSLLERAQEGYDKEVPMSLADGSTKTVLVPEYDLPLVADWSRTLSDLISKLDDKPPVIYIKEMRFMYRAPTSSYTDPFYDVEIGEAGDYLIELKGASGGHVWTKTNYTSTGGKGGFVSGIFNIAADTTLRFRIGGQGYGSSSYDAANFEYGVTSYGGGITAYVGTTPNIGVTMTSWDSGHAGGYNGGGKGGNAGVGNYRGGSGGGGATDVQLANDERKLTGNSEDSRFMVAGGGGGACQQEGGNNGNQALGGGDAGGLVGISGTGGGSDKPRGGGQASYSGGTPSLTTDGSAGVGASGINGISPGKYEGRGGGGGGWFGGGAATANSGSYVFTGAGGSSYVIEAGVSKGGVTRTGSEPVNETNPKQEYSNGWARIVWVDKK